MSKYENNVFPYFLHYIVNLTAWRSKDTDITLMSLLRLFTEKITFDRKGFFSKLHKCCIDEIREELSTSHFVT